MLDLRQIRKSPEEVKQKLSLRNHPLDSIDSIIELDKTRRSNIKKVEDLKKERNDTNKQISEIRKAGGDASEIIAQMKEISKQIKTLDNDLSQIERRIDEQLLVLPNLPAEGVPAGDESNNKEMRTWGEPRKFSFTPKPHWDIGKDLDILDIERAARMSGSGFVCLKGMGARLERALISFMLDIHTQESGYTEIAPPHLVNRYSITCSGQLPKLEGDMYNTQPDDLFIIPTSEVMLVNLYQGEKIPYESLPMNLTAVTSCFRREAGAAGKDTRGLLRVHEFKKVELVKYVEPEHSFDELEKLTGHAESILQKLEIPYRVLLLAAGDAATGSAKTYDLEIWSPGVDRWLEVSSCSNCTDYQARRGDIRYKKKGGKPQFVHTLNGSGVALPRLIAAILENFQLEDGHVEVPKVLQPYLNGVTII